MNTRRGLRTADLLLVVVVSAVSLRYVTHPLLFADPRGIPVAIRNGSVRNDSSYWLSPLAVCSAAAVLLGVTIGSRFAAGRGRRFLEGWALGGGALLFLGAAPAMSQTLFQSVLPLHWLGLLREPVFRLCTGLADGAFVVGCGWEHARTRAGNVVLSAASVGVGPPAGWGAVVFANGLNAGRPWATAPGRLALAFWPPLVLAAFAWSQPVPALPVVVTAFVLAVGVVSFVTLFGPSGVRGGAAVFAAAGLAVCAAAAVVGSDVEWFGGPWGGGGRVFEDLALRRFPGAIASAPVYQVNVRPLRFCLALLSAWLVALTAARAVRLATAPTPRTLLEPERTHG